MDKTGVDSSNSNSAAVGNGSNNPKKLITSHVSATTDELDPYQFNPQLTFNIYTSKRKLLYCPNTNGFF